MDENINSKRQELVSMLEDYEAKGFQDANRLKLYYTYYLPNVKDEDEFLRGLGGGDHGYIQTFRRMTRTAISYGDMNLFELLILTKVKGTEIGGAGLMDCSHLPSPICKKIRELIVQYDFNSLIQSYGSITQAIRLAIYYRDVETYRLLIDEGMNLYDEIDWDNQMSAADELEFLRALENNDAELLDSLLEYRGGDTDIIDYEIGDGYKFSNIIYQMIKDPLLLAIDRGFADTVRVLIKHGADIKKDFYKPVRDAFKWHLDWPLQSNRLDVLRIIVSVAPQDIFNFVIEQGNSFVGGNNVKMIDEFLLNNGADIHWGDDWALRFSMHKMISSWNGRQFHPTDINLVKFLINSGANVRADNNYVFNLSIERWPELRDLHNLLLEKAKTQTPLSYSYDSKSDDDKEEDDSPTLHCDEFIRQNSPINEAWCKQRRKYRFRFHPDKNPGCKKEANDYFSRFDNVCDEVEKRSKSFKSR